MSKERVGHSRRTYGSIGLAGGVAIWLAQPFLGPALLHAEAPPAPSETAQTEFRPPNVSTQTVRKDQRFLQKTVTALAWPFRPVKDFSDAAFEGLFRLFPSGQNLPSHLKNKRHWDYPWPFHRIPRGWTTFRWGKPKMLLGNQVSQEEGSPKPIGEPGSFQFSRYPDLPIPLSWLPLYLAVTTSGGTHFRLGARWDDVDAYTQFPSVAIKHLEKKRSKDAPPHQQ
ncbi:MAG: hypothetical protein IPP35_05485 [Elusimicrobia bacterium]|nr:hypothetical protein [Elusimicrobiota bacterium]